MTKQPSQSLSVGHIMFRAMSSSVRRAVSSTFSLLSLPLLVLAAISAAKLLRLLDVIEPQGWFAVMITWQTWIVHKIAELLASLHIVVPTQVIDFGFFYVFLGNAVARAERDELLAVELDKGTAWGTFKSALLTLRADYFFYSIPKRLRGFLLRLLWPLAAGYRMTTRWVVDGPGLDGTKISTSVRSNEILGFARMIQEAGQWQSQSVFDHRIVLLCQVLLSFAVSAVLQTTAKLM